MITLLTATCTVPLYAAETCKTTDASVLQNNRIILGAPLLTGAVKSLRAVSPPDPEDFRQFSTTTDIDFDPCGQITQFKFMRSEIRNKMQITRILTASETTDNALYTLRNYRHRPGKKDRYPMVIDTVFTKDTRQQITGGSGKMYVENNDTVMPGDVQVQFDNARVSDILTHWPHLKTDQHFSFGYDDKDRLTSVKSDSQAPMTQTYTYTQEGYPATQEEIFDGEIAGSRYFTQCLTHDSHGNCIKEHVTSQNIYGGASGLKTESSVIVNKTIRYYP
ncbi:hypothetical protein [Morganella psychrotolerans]|uniref:hypothetical protein n=1 Tax=Morganella psychrotolerans TaxID=368603 RepID=UPI0039B06B8B